MSEPSDLEVMLENLKACGRTPMPGAPGAIEKMVKEVESAIALWPHERNTKGIE